jgi:hypothetical protein
MQDQRQMALVSLKVSGDWSEGRELRFQKAGRKAVVAVKLNVIEGRGDTVPAGHSGGFGAAHMRARHHDDAAEAQRLVDQYDFKFERSADGEMSGAEKIDAGRTDVASNESDGKFLWDSRCSAEAQGKIQSSTGIFAMFWMDAYGVSRHADEAARLRGAKERGNTKRRDTRISWQWLHYSYAFTSFRGRLFWPQFNFSCAIRCAHHTLRDGNAQMFAKTEQN